MTLFGPKAPLPPIPDDVSIPQFMLRAADPSRPLRPSNIPFFIEDKTGRAISFEEVHYRTYALANALSIKWNIGINDVVCLFTPNHIVRCSPANPNYTSDELKYQLTTSNAKLLITHPNCLDTARIAAHAYGLTDASIVLLDPSPTSGITTAEELISFGASRPENYKAIVYKPGETKKTLAFLSFSSGTTGKPKAVAIAHFSVVANISQMAAHYHMDDPSYPHKRIIPGDVIMGGE
ncbi:hypothetical protein NLJ89_g2402 [Agrocybe chaxingu]|uniref:AMP-dependent synthetase/ligase domain-containing protein n=1 Tax=Agrocybe chaxingu TaxID=84603 RepID=A0A9W8K6N6_9AGAR|nr:hypothetical protein NLJ89_g2402 [Agrocybe chaxingu]